MNPVTKSEHLDDIVMRVGKEEKEEKVWNEPKNFGFYGRHRQSQLPTSFLNMSVDRRHASRDKLSGRYGGEILQNSALEVAIAGRRDTT